MAEIAIVLFHVVVRMSRLEDHAALLPHKGLDYLLVLLGKRGVTLRVTDEQLLIDLERVDSFSNPPL